LVVGAWGVRIPALPLSSEKSIRRTKTLKTTVSNQPIWTLLVNIINRYYFTMIVMFYIKEITLTSIKYFIIKPFTDILTLLSIFSFHVLLINILKCYIIILCRKIYSLHYHGTMTGVRQKYWIKFGDLFPDLEKIPYSPLHGQITFT